MTVCRELDGPALEATVPGTYGTIIEIQRHLIDSEMSYVVRLTGAWSARPWQADEPVGLDVLAERAAVLAPVLEQFLAGEWDSERLGEARGDEHRAHICTMLGALGHEPPDVSAWGYALATGRMTPTTTPADA